MNTHAPRTASERGLIVALLALAALYVGWFRDDRHLLAALVVFALPPVLMAVLVVARRRHAAFWSGVIALLWFCHGVTAAWVHPHERGWAFAAIVLSLAIVLTASWPGLAARARQRRAR